VAYLYREGAPRPNLQKAESGYFTDVTCRLRQLCRQRLAIDAETCPGGQAPFGRARCLLLLRAERANLDRAADAQRRDAFGQRESFLAAFRLDEVKPADLLLGFRERSVDDARARAVAPQRGARCHRLEPRGHDVPAGGFEPLDPGGVIGHDGIALLRRSEERRVGKEGRRRWPPEGE